MILVLKRGGVGVIRRLTSYLDATRLALNDDALTIDLSGSYVIDSHH